MGETTMFAVPISSEQVVHSGVKGMKWYEHKFGDWERHAQYAAGQPNPETAGDRRDGIVDRVKAAAEARAEKKQEEYESEKQRVLQTGSAQDILKYKGQLSNQEMQNAISRLNLERQLKDINDKDNYVETGWDKADKIFSKVGKVSGYVGTVAGAIGNVNNLITNGSNLIKFAKTHTKEYKEHQKDLATKSYDELLKDRDNLSVDDIEYIQKRAKSEKDMYANINGLDLGKQHYDDQHKKPDDAENQNGSDTPPTNPKDPTTGGGGSSGGKSKVDEAVNAAKEFNREAQEKSDPNVRKREQDLKYEQILKERAAKAEAQKTKEEQKRAEDKENFDKWDFEMHRVAKQFGEKKKAENDVKRAIKAVDDAIANERYEKKVAESAERIKNAPLAPNKVTKEKLPTVYEKIQNTVDAYQNNQSNSRPTSSGSVSTSINKGKNLVNSLFESAKSLRNSGPSPEMTAEGEKLLSANRSLLDAALDFSDPNKKR